MHPITPERLRAAYESATQFDHPLISYITTDQFSAEYPERPDWAIGPFRRDDSLTFTQPATWNDPTGIGWTDGFIFNPSLLVEDDTLHLFYRASPRKESMCSRIGLAHYTRETGWVDDPANPILFPTLDNEVLSVEDPKIYKADDGRYVLFYNGIWDFEGTEEAERYPSFGHPLENIGCDIMVAVSDDLVHWEKRGIVVPYEISRLWVKGAVIPRTTRGEAVRIGGEYLMYLSEGCNGVRYVGHSDDLVTWRFEQQDYLDLSEYGGTLFEVACAVTGHDDSGDLVLDFFYQDADGELAAAQALYSVDAPFTQRELHRGGSLAWGGLAGFDGGVYFAQGWDAAEGSRELYFYRAVAGDDE